MYFTALLKFLAVVLGSTIGTALFFGLVFSSFSTVTRGNDLCTWQEDPLPWRFVRL